MTIGNDNDMMLKSEKIDLQTPILSASNWWYFYCLKSSLQCSFIVGLVFSTSSIRRWCAEKAIWRRWIGRRMTDGRATLRAWRPSITERCPSVDHWQTRTQNPGLELSKPENPGLEKTAGFANPSYVLLFYTINTQYFTKTPFNIVFSLFAGSHMPNSKVRLIITVEATLIGRPSPDTNSDSWCINGNWTRVCWVRASLTDY